MAARLGRLGGSDSLSLVSMLAHRTKRVKERKDVHEPRHRYQVFGRIIRKADRPRSGRKPTHSQEVRSALISLALQKPRLWGVPELRTLERLHRALKQRRGVHLSDWTIWNWMDEEGDSKAGSTRRSNTTHSSWKNGIYHPGLCDAASEDEGGLR
jgi:hypothetical protein